jgi:hypothetical protein
MALVDYFLSQASSSAVRSECERRKLHPLVAGSPLSPALVYEEITGAELIELLPKTFIDPNDGKTYAVRKTLWDAKYRLTTDEEIKRFLAWKKALTTQAYEVDYYDCNSFALSLWAAARDWTRGLCLGMSVVRRSGHGQNWFMNINRQKRGIEPQNCVVVGLDSTVEHFLI